MAERATKRRSARQLAGRKRSIYYDPESEDELFNFRDDAEEDQESQPEPLPEPSQSQRPKKKRKVHNPPRRQTRLKVKAKERWLSSGKGRRKDGKPRKKKHRVVKTLISPSKRKAANMVFTGPSDEVKPAWTSLPIEILRDIFIFASQPMQEYTITARYVFDCFVREQQTTADPYRARMFHGLSKPLDHAGHSLFRHSKHTTSRLHSSTASHRISYSNCFKYRKRSYT